MKVTRQLVAERLRGYLRGEWRLEEIVSWAEEDIPKSLQIFLASSSLISLCLGTDDLLFKAGLYHHE